MSSSEPGIRAAIRDASWFRNPSTSGPDLVWHVVAPEVHESESACGIAVTAWEGAKRNRVDATKAAESVKPEHCCRRAGCRARWPDYKERIMENAR
jgi:hypothetical protein